MSDPRPGNPRTPIALTIAGSDSGGGAGIQADLKTFHAFQTFGTSVVTAITAQNTLGVRDVHPIPARTVRSQMEALAADLPPDACKTGMLATRELVLLVAEGIEELGFPHLVLDPVMVSSSGARLLDESAEEAVRNELLPRARIVTPNTHEAGILAGMAIGSAEDAERAAHALLERGVPAVLMKGGHLSGPEVINILLEGDERYEWRTPRLETRHTHGTGCTLSAAIAAGLAYGRELPAAVEEALDFVHRAIRAAPGLGAGHGPLNHLVPAASPAATPS